MKIDIADPLQSQAGNSTHLNDTVIRTCAENNVRSAIREIVFPSPGDRRSRVVVSRSNARSTGKYPGWKMGRMMHWESFHELNAFRLLDCDPSVLSFYEQPCKIVYVLGGVVATHYPDLLVVTGEGKEFWEVKPQSNASEPDVLARSNFLSEALQAWGYRYRVVVGENLARQPRLNNANLILRLGHRSLAVCDWEHLRRAISNEERLLWSDACNGVYGARGRETFCSLVLRGKLTIDVESPISSTTQFFPKDGGG